jgi:integrase
VPKLPKGMFRRKGRPGWYVRVHRGGREKWVSLGTDFKKAEGKAKVVHRGETPLGSSRLTVREAADRWVESYVRTQRTGNGQSLAKQRVRDFFDPFLGQVLLERVTREDVRAFRLWLERTTRLRVTSVWHVLSDLRCLLNWCEDAGLVERSPFPRRVMPRLQELPPDRLTDEEADRLRVLPDPHGFVCRLALGTGLRWGELCRAQAADVERGFLVVHQTKSGKVRRVPLSPELVGEVRGRVGRLVGFAVVSPGSFAKAVRRATEIERFPVHQMRHTFACQWLERGGSLAALQQILGHASIVTTQRYAKLTDEVVMREAERIGSQCWKAGQ